MLVRITYLIYISCILLFLTRNSFAFVSKKLTSCKINPLLYKNGFRLPFSLATKIKTDNGNFDDRQSPQKQRKKKKNKYSSFSKVTGGALDPFEAMIAESTKKNNELQNEKRRKEEKNKSVNPQRVNIEFNDTNDSDDTEEILLNKLEDLNNSEKGQTRERNKREFPPTNTIDPYDPTTYGFTELGTILGPHGVKGEMKLSASTGFWNERLCPSSPEIRHLRMPNRKSPREGKEEKSYLDNILFH